GLGLTRRFRPMASDRISKASDPTDPPSVRAIREAGAKLRPLHRRKARPNPGDWLDQHQEDGQTFDEYRASNPNRPNAERTTLYIQPLGDFDATQSKLIATTSDLLGRFYGVPVKTLDRIGLDVVPVEARRV